MFQPWDVACRLPALSFPPMADLIIFPIKPRGGLELFHNIAFLKVWPDTGKRRHYGAGGKDCFGGRTCRMWREWRPGCLHFIRLETPAVSYCRSRRYAQDTQSISHSCSWAALNFSSSHFKTPHSFMWVCILEYHTHPLLPPSPTFHV